MTSFKESVEALRAFLFRRRQAYISTFSGEVPKVVLADLARFCRANESTAHPNPDMWKQLEGRRQVWLRIQQHLQLTEDEIWDLLGRPDLEK